MLVIQHGGITITWRFEDEFEMQKARFLARAHKVTFFERWGALSEGIIFTRRTEYETTLKALGEGTCSSGI
jgi:hypothetical protein